MQIEEKKKKKSLNSTIVKEQQLSDKHLEQFSFASITELHFQNIKQISI